MNFLKTYGINYLQKNETPEKDWKIGFEVERFAVDPNTGVQLPYNSKKQSIKKIIEILVSKYDFKPVFHEGHLMGAKTNFADISIEPGSQFEIAFNPSNHFNDLIHNFIKINDILCEISAAEGFSWLSVGYNPFCTPDQIQIIPKKRYQIMAEYLSSRGNKALHMMKCTASIQTSVDFETELHFKQIFKFSHLMAPIMTGLFANSPFRFENKNYLNFRNLIWRNVDNNRCGNIFPAVSGNLGYSEYMDYISDIPAMLAYNSDKKLVNLKNLKNSNYFNKSKLDPEINLDLILSSIFTISRAKNYVEFRIFDALPLDLVMLPPLLSSILFYSKKALNKLNKLFMGFTEEDMLKAFKQASLFGINGDYKNIKISNFAQKIVNICKDSIHDVKGVKISPEIANKLLKKVEKLIINKKSPAEHSILKNVASSFPGILVDDNFIKNSDSLKKLIV